MSRYLDLLAEVAAEEDEENTPPTTSVMRAAGVTMADLWAWTFTAPAPYACLSFLDRHPDGGATGRSDNAYGRVNNADAGSAVEEERRKEDKKDNKEEGGLDDDELMKVFCVLASALMDVMRGRADEEGQVRALRRLRRARVYHLPRAPADSLLHALWTAIVSKLRDALNIMCYEDLDRFREMLSALLSSGDAEASSEILYLVELLPTVHFLKTEREMYIDGIDEVVGWANLIEHLAHSSNSADLRGQALEASFYLVLYLINCESDEGDDESTKRNERLETSCRAMFKSILHSCDSKSSGDSTTDIIHLSPALMQSLLYPVLDDQGIAGTERFLSTLTTFSEDPDFVRAVRGAFTGYHAQG